MHIDCILYCDFTGHVASLLELVSCLACVSQEQAGLLPWGTAASAMGSSLHGASAASLPGHLGRSPRDHPQGSVFSSGTSSVCWGWPSTRTQLCLSLSARTAMPSSTNAKASSSPFCRESTCPRWAPGSPAHSRCSLLCSFGGAQGKPHVLCCSWHRKCLVGACAVGREGEIW